MNPTTYAIDVKEHMTAEDVTLSNGHKTLTQNGMLKDYCGVVHS